MSITINRVTCNKWGQELAAAHGDIRSVCEFLNSAVLQTQRGFAVGRVYHGGYIHPTPVKQGTFYLYPIEAGEFTLTPHPFEQHPLAVMEEVLTKEMLTSYLYEVSAVVAALAATLYAFAHPDAYNLDRQEKWVSKYQRDAAEYFNAAHIAALREDMQRAASRVPFCEQEMGHARHAESKIFEQWKYSQELLKRARHEINKRGAKVNRLRKEVKELEGAVQHLAKENVHLTEQLRGAGVVTHTDYRPEFVRAVHKFVTGQHVSPLRERYKDLIGYGENHKRYVLCQTVQSGSKFSQYVCKEYDVMQSAHYAKLRTYGLTLPIGKYVVSAPENTPQHVIDVGRTLMANLGRTAGIIDCDVEIQALHKSGFYLLRAWVRTARNQKHTDSRCVNTENLSDAHRICAELLADIMSYLFGQPPT